MKTNLHPVIIFFLGLVLIGCGETSQITLPTKTVEVILPTHTIPTYTPSPTRVPEYFGTISGESANIRGGPGTNYEVISSFAQDTELKIIGRNTDSSWLVIELPGGTPGWIRVDLILFTFSVELLEIHAVPPTPTARPYIPPAATSCAGETVQVSIINDTGSAVSLTLRGPCTYTFYLGTGSSNITVLPGNYSYSAYGCGGATIQGSKDLGSGDEWTWYCQ